MICLQIHSAPSFASSVGPFWPHAYGASVSMNFSSKVSQWSVTTWFFVYSSISGGVPSTIAATGWYFEIALSVSERCSVSVAVALASVA